MFIDNNFHNLIIDCATEISDHITSYFFTHWQNRYTIDGMKEFVLKCTDTKDFFMVRTYTWVLTHIMEDLHYNNFNGNEWDLEEIIMYIDELDDSCISRWVEENGILD